MLGLIVGDMVSRGEQVSWLAGVPYFGFLPTGLAVCVAVFFFGSGSTNVNVAAGLLGVPAVLEGVMLLSNAFGCADEFSRRLRANADMRSPFRFMGPWYVRSVVGVGFFVLGVLPIWDAMRYS